MPTQTDRLGLIRHTTADRYRVQDYTDNWNLLDSYPGVYLCESNNWPTTWGAPQRGLLMMNPDTGLPWRWDGSQFLRMGPKGWLASNERTVDLSNTSTAYAVAVQATVTIAAGNRPVLLVVEGPGVASTVGLTGFGLFRGTTVVQEWEVSGGTGTGVDRPPPLSFIALDVPVAGSVTYSLQFRAVPGFGGTSTVKANGPNGPLALHVIEA